ncbi:MAG: isochorismatase family protein [Treponema sp.]|nr:isochorismatase family protein [Treponema sp.]
MKLFFMIDMQNDFFTGNLQNESAVNLLPKLVETVKKYKKNGYVICAIRDTHDESYFGTDEGKSLPIIHCMEDTAGWEVVDELQPFVDIYCNKKGLAYNSWRDFEPFGMLSFDIDIVNKELGSITDVVMCSSRTASSLVANYASFKASYPEVAVTILKDLCVCDSDESNEAGLTVLEAMHAAIK